MKRKHTNVFKYNKLTVSAHPTCHVSDSMPRNQLCRFCMGHGPRYTCSQIPDPASYASVLVGDVWADIRLCETRFIPSFTTWCMECESISFMCPDGFPDVQPEGASVVNGPSTIQHTQSKSMAFEAQIVLWRQLQTLSLTTVVSSTE
jgi:hypothetical protein